MLYLRLIGRLQRIYFLSNISHPRAFKFKKYNSIPSQQTLTLTRLTWQLFVLTKLQSFRGCVNKQWRGCPTSVEVLDTVDIGMKLIVYWTLYIMRCLGNCSCFCCQDYFRASVPCIVVVLFKLYTDDHAEGHWISRYSFCCSLAILLKSVLEDFLISWAISSSRNEACRGPVD